jgi:hypothetical protein
MNTKRSNKVKREKKLKLTSHRTPFRTNYSIQARYMNKINVNLSIYTYSFRLNIEREIIIIFFVVVVRLLSQLWKDVSFNKM